MNSNLPLKSSAFPCYLLAFLSGAGIMMLEVGGARLLTPFFGVSLFVWTAQIAVALLALSLGYWWGGKKADQNPSFSLVLQLLLLAAFYLLLLPRVSPYVLRFFGGWGLRKGVLLCALVLFGPPLSLLGALSPYLLRILSDSLFTLGKKVGVLYALSTLGSMAGTLSIGYYLLPALGVEKIIYLISFCLMIPAVFLLIFQEKKIVYGFLCLLLTLLPLGLLLQPPALIDKTLVGHPGKPRLQELYRVDSFYGKIQVVDFNQRYRTLLISGIPQAQMDITTGKNTLEYIDHLRLLGQAYVPGAHRALFWGLGAGVLEREFRLRGLKTTAVEIDPQVAEVARKYFYWDAPLDSLCIEDARFFLEKEEETFDLIFVDCFSGEELPFYLLSRQALGRMKERLSPQGVLLINFPSISRLASPLAPACLSKTLQTLFPHHRILAGSNYQDDGAICNYIFAASEKPLTLTSLGTPPSPGLTSLLARRVDFAHPQARVLQDDFNPLDIYEQEAREFFRRRIWKSIDWDFLVH